MADIPQCQTCRWFYRDAPDHKAGQCRGLLWIPSAGSVAGGYVQGPAIVRSDVLPYPMVARWEDRILVAADFGCAHHDPKEAA